MTTQESTDRNAERFLVAFNRIDRRLAAISGVEIYRSFGEKLRGAARQDALVARIAPDLREMSELRNAIVHSDHPAPLADPRDEVVEEIERYARALTAPPLLGDHFSREVTTVQADDSVRTAVQRMRQQGYTQLPVRDRRGRCYALLTSSGIARWLGAIAGDRHVDLDAVTVNHVLKEDGDQNRYMLMPPGATLADALDAFENHHRSGVRLEAILLCKDAAADQPLVGIVTPRDLPALLMALDLPGGGH